MARFWKIQRGGGSYEKSLLWGVGMDIFWNHTFIEHKERYFKIVARSQN